MMAKKNTGPSWSDVKAELINADRDAFLLIIKDLYAASKQNQLFLHTRLGLGDDALKPYKVMIDRWLWPDILSNQDTSISKAKKAITDYKKAAGKPEAILELMIFYCEQAIGFAASIGFQDEVYFEALIRMFEQALKQLSTLPENLQGKQRERLIGVVGATRDFGYGVYDDLSDLLSKYP